MISRRPDHAPGCLFCTLCCFPVVLRPRSKEKETKAGRTQARCRDKGELKTKPQLTKEATTSSTITSDCETGETDLYLLRPATGD